MGRPCARSSAITACAMIRPIPSPCRLRARRWCGCGWRASATPTWSWCAATWASRACWGTSSSARSCRRRSGMAGPAGGGRHQRRLLACECVACGAAAIRTARTARRWGSSAATAPSPTILSLPIANLYPVPDVVTDEQAVFVEPLAAACEILEQVTDRTHRSRGCVGRRQAGLAGRGGAALDRRRSAPGRAASRQAGDCERLGCGGAARRRAAAACRLGRCRGGMHRQSDRLCAGAAPSAPTRHAGAEEHLSRRSARGYERVGRR